MKTKKMKKVLIVIALFLGCFNSIAQADLVATVTNGQGQYLIGSTIVYTITITNQGPNDAINVNIVNDLPSGTTNGSWTGPEGTGGVGSLNVIVPVITVGETLVYTLQLTIPQTYDTNLNLVNTVSISSATIDPSPECPGCTDVDTSAPKYITITNAQYSIPDLITDVLINSECAIVSNFVAQPAALSSNCGIGYFKANNSDFPFRSGVVIRNGNVIATQGHYTGNDMSSTCSGLGDPQLLAVSQAQGNSGTINDASFIKFNFTPLTNNFSFNFLMASNEYGTYQCGFADVFAFLLTDITTGVTTNVAVIPGTTIPISVLTIRDIAHNAGCPSVNPEYFGQFNQTLPVFDTPINMRGQTVVFNASALVIPNNPYSIKLTIGDYNDSAFDSAIFLESGSFNLCQDVVKLEAFVDANNNGTKEPSEISYNQGTFNYTVNNTTQTGVNYSPSGSVFIPVETSTDSFDFGFEVYPDLASYFNCTTVISDITYNPAGNNTYYFPITNTLPYNDVEVSLTATAGPNPGFQYTNKITYTNKGLTSASGTLTFAKAPALTINTISQAGTEATANGFTYTFSDLAPNEIRTIVIGLQTPTIPAVVLGDMLTNTVSSSTAGDINITNNTADLTQIVTGSFDPNDKMESHGPEILFSSFGPDDYLYYTIRFQNTGTANAQSVIITDLLSADLDEQSIRMISASHDYTMNRMGNDLEWTFETIDLVPSSVSEAASQGYVHFKIKPKPGYMVGDIIPNTAQIYFDFNDAIVTNTFETEFVATLGVADFTAENLIIYPNPATNQVSISVQNSNDAIAEIRLTDMLGKVVFQQKGTPSQTTIDLSGLSKGVYMLEVQTEHQFSVVKKLVKN